MELLLRFLELVPKIVGLIVQKLLNDMTLD